MHKLRILFGIAAVLFSAALLATEPPWKKPPAEWSKDDALAILRESPWVRTVALTPARVTSPDPGVAEVRSSMPRIRGDSEKTPVAAPAPRRSTPSGINQPRDGRSSGAALDVIVRWLSSQTLRQAIARHRELKGLPKEPSLGLYAMHYTIGISGFRVGSLKRGATPWLEFHPGKQKVLAEGIEVLNGSTATSVAEVIIYFPRTVDGKPLLGAGIDKVTFVCEYQIGQRSYPVRADFHLRKMTRDGVPDL